jgi:hypothetical protein
MVGSKWGNQGAGGTASPNSLIKKFTPPVCEALGVIGINLKICHIILLLIKA